MDTIVILCKETKTNITDKFWHKIRGAAQCVTAKLERTMNRIKELPETKMKIYANNLQIIIKCCKQIEV